ncbi:asparaginase [Nitrospirillum bahiense]|uniref:Asparaginase n=1 Tax=Nitrospirillum amazonense TaxID=28077 RepID=A0A560FAC3_9PROT|nr:asparaginase [Nitrospirillum amazonense]TWB18569.1 asparaginase [Nitrospirillum amazonense]
MHDHDDHEHHHGDGCCGGHDHQPAPQAQAPQAHATVRQVDIPDRSDAPILVEVTRGSMVESRHRGRVVVVDAGARVVAHWGDVDGLIYPRSSNKALQAIPLIESGAADAYAVTDEELALACASHQGEAMHTERVAAWLDRLGLSVDDLECGAHLPTHEPTASALLAAGQKPTALHNNCSGKHTGFLAVAKHKGEKLAGYVRYQHPVQQRILGVIEQVTGHDLSRAPWGVDGCSIPTIGLPLGALALGMARLADPDSLPDRRAEAVMRLRRAWGKHPELVGGTGNFDTEVMRAANSAVLLKSGAEGVCCAVLPEHGLGIALKIEDGAPRAAGPAMAAVLKRLGVLPDTVWDGVATLAVAPVTSRKGEIVGEIRPTAVAVG